jgi:hypothetical protein
LGFDFFINAFFYYHSIPLGFIAAAFQKFPSLRGVRRRTGWVYAFPVGEGQDGAKTRNAVIEPAEMSYKCNPSGIYAPLHFIPSVEEGRGGFFFKPIRFLKIIGF